TMTQTMKLTSKLRKAHSKLGVCPAFRNWRRCMDGTFVMLERGSQESARRAYAGLLTPDCNRAQRERRASAACDHTPHGFRTGGEKSLRLTSRVQSNTPSNRRADFRNLRKIV